MPIRAALGRLNLSTGLSVWHVIASLGRADRPAGLSGKRAPKALEQLSGVDLLFTDIGLPDGMSGRKLGDEMSGNKFISLQVHLR